MWIYLLILEHNRFYVGNTQNLLKSRNYYLQTPKQLMTCTNWIRDNTILAFIPLFQTQDPLQENRIFLYFVTQFTIENVRGSNYSSQYLNRRQIENIEMEKRGSRNQCCLCGAAERPLYCLSEQLVNGQLNVVLPNQMETYSKLQSQQILKIKDKSQKQKLHQQSIMLGKKQIETGSLINVNAKIKKMDIDSD